MHRPASTLTRSFLIASALTVLGVGLSYVLVGMPPLLGAEDASIGFRYARNLAEGHGIVFNPGGERVEGFTSMLWLLVSAAVVRVFGEGALEAVLFLLSIGLTLFTVGAVLWLVEDRTGEESPAVWVAGAWLAGLAGFYFWSGLSLMDVALWGSGLAAYLVLLVRRFAGRESSRVTLPLVVVALVLTRPESMLVVPATAVVCAVFAGLTRPAKRAALDAVITSAFAVAALTVFRVFYFGHPLPNTYYAKVSPDLAFRVRGGLRYLWEYLSSHPLGWVGAGTLVAVLATGLLAALPRVLAERTAEDEPPVPVGAMAGALIAIGIASVVYGGGDHYQGHRFLQAYLPLAAIPVALGVEALRTPLAARAPRIGGALTAIALVVLVAPLPLEWAAFRRHDLRRQAFDVGLQGRFVGITLDEAFADTIAPELGLWMVGGAGYAYRGPVKDLLGLNWIAMGMSPGDRKGPRDHAAFNLDVFWSDPPELMIPEPEAVLRGIRCVSIVLGGAMQGVLVSARFRDRFEPVRIQRGDSEPIIAFARTDWVVGAPAVVQRLGWSYCDGTGPPEG